MEESKSPKSPEAFPNHSPHSDITQESTQLSFSQIHVTGPSPQGDMVMMEEMRQLRAENEQLKAEKIQDRVNTNLQHLQPTRIMPIDSQQGLPHPGMQYMPANQYMPTQQYVPQQYLPPPYAGYPYGHHYPYPYNPQQATFHQQYGPSFGLPPPVVPVQTTFRDSHDMRLTEHLRNQSLAAERLMMDSNHFSLMYQQQQPTVHFTEQSPQVFYRQSVSTPNPQRTAFPVSTQSAQEPAAHVDFREREPQRFSIPGIIPAPPYHSTPSLHSAPSNHPAPSYHSAPSPVTHTVVPDPPEQIAPTTIFQNGFSLQEQMAATMPPPQNGTTLYEQMAKYNRSVNVSYTMAPPDLKLLRLAPSKGENRLSLKFVVDFVRTFLNQCKMHNYPLRMVNLIDVAYLTDIALRQPRPMTYPMICDADNMQMVVYLQLAFQPETLHEFMAHLKDLTPFGWKGTRLLDTNIEEYRSAFHRYVENFRFVYHFIADQNPYCKVKIKAGKDTVVRLFCDGIVTNYGDALFAKFSNTHEYPTIDLFLNECITLSVPQFNALKMANSYMHEFNNPLRFGRDRENDQSLASVSTANVRRYPRGNNSNDIRRDSSKPFNRARQPRNPYQGRFAALDHDDVGDETNHNEQDEDYYDEGEEFDEDEDIEDVENDAADDNAVVNDSATLSALQSQRSGFRQPSSTPFQPRPSPYHSNYQSSKQPVQQKDRNNACYEKTTTGTCSKNDCKRDHSEAACFAYAENLHRKQKSSPFFAKLSAIAPYLCAAYMSCFPSARTNGIVRVGGENLTATVLCDSGSDIRSYVSLEFLNSIREKVANNIYRVNSKVFLADDHTFVTISESVVLNMFSLIPEESQSQEE